VTAGWRTVRRNNPADQYPEMIKPSSPDYVVLARRTAARLAVVHGASAEDLREVLESLGLVEPLSVSKPSGRHRGQMGGSNAPTARTGGPTGGSRARSTDEKGRWTPKERENPELCSKQLHPWTPDNQIHRPDRGVSCRACANLSRQARRVKARERANAEKPVSPKPTKPAKPVKPKTARGPRMCGAGLHEIPPEHTECRPCTNTRAVKTRAARKVKLAERGETHTNRGRTSPGNRCRHPHRGGSRV